MNQYLDFSNLLKEICGGENVCVNENMSMHISFKVGGPVDIMVLPKNYDEVKKVIICCNENNVPWFVMGNGSNLLVSDKGIRGVVIKLTKLNEITVSGANITAQCGALLSDISDTALSNSLTGFEFACGIPGCMGGAAAMNAGAYISEISNVLESALAIDREGNYLKLSREDMDFGYRKSIFLKEGYIVLETELGLKHGDYETIKYKIDDLQNKRKTKQPLEFPSAGSTFKRPEGHFAGKLIEDTGLKGFKIGGAEVSPKHSGFIINSGNATCKDIVDLIEEVQKQVYEKYNINLKTEVRIIGEK